ncbi:MAG: iron-sulfur cluster assembly accessory protein [Candidatus Eisenbacteria bacterium]|nr:iron-sulfur cluster assembly accessory protein [Candidatus Eisenbacteria bacterium]
MITITDKAKEKMQSIMESRGRAGSGIRVRIAGVSTNGYKHELSFVAPGEEEGEDRVIDMNGLKIHVDPHSAERLEGTKLDFVEDDEGAGFVFDNPNQVSWSDPEMGKKVQALIDSEINPALASHGGFVEIHDVKDGKVYVRMGGGCRGCAMAHVTIRDGVEKVLKEKVPEIQGVVDITDHGA